MTWILSTRLVAPGRFQRQEICPLPTPRSLDSGETITHPYAVNGMVPVTRRAWAAVQQVVDAVQLIGKWGVQPGYSRGGWSPDGTYKFEVQLPGGVEARSSWDARDLANAEFADAARFAGKVDALSAFIDRHKSEFRAV